MNGKDYPMICISVGNPHAVVFMEDIDSLDIEKLGPDFEKHERFPDRTNTEFVQVVDEGTSGCACGSAGQERPWPAVPAPRHRP